MEQMIIIALLIVIILMLSDRKYLAKELNENDADPDEKLPSIMGDTKQGGRHILPIETTARQQLSASMTADNFESETINGQADDVIQSKSLNDILIKDDEWEQEEEDWKYHDSNVESGFATGVTFQELSTAGQLLQEDLLEPDLKQQAAEIIQKVQGTELFDLLEDSLGDASKRIANLLNQSILNTDESTASKEGVEGFDIGEFV
ncbi:hypothetical protein [uncultured Chryseobacterium sp.]|uniref:hypothetical protein n=1 Tax=uncultured Chryseobacterium sp. TaxID=259322 RepID=UPI0025DBCC92|nr:hypothetical protein [uncultured Chryseobacterium sp.]